MRSGVRHHGIYWYEIRFVIFALAPLAISGTASAASENRYFPQQLYLNAPDRFSLLSTERNQPQSWQPLTSAIPGPETSEPTPLGSRNLRQIRGLYAQTWPMLRLKAFIAFFQSSLSEKKPPTVNQPRSSVQAMGRCPPLALSGHGD